MDGLLHWDFNPGLAVADQVGRRFGETIHFSPSRSTKEFFWVVSFSSASFPLSVESVGVALQCCIGGHPKGFNVLQIGDRSFRFSVAGNKVGHFIHGLKDRIWPDFICHFHLYNGRYTGFQLNDSHWHADETIDSIAARTPRAVKINTKFLEQSAATDASAGKELSKFGLIPISHMKFNNKNYAEASSSSNVQIPAVPLESSNLAPPSITPNHASDTLPQEGMNINTSPLLVQSSRAESPDDRSDISCIKLGSFLCRIDAPYPSPLSVFYPLRLSMHHPMRSGLRCSVIATRPIWPKPIMVSKKFLNWPKTGPFYALNVCNGATRKSLAQFVLSASNVLLLVIKPLIAL